MTHTPLRMLRHLATGRRAVHRALDAAALQRLQQAITASEQGHDGQIRLCVEAALPWRYLRGRASPRDRALTMFAKLRVWDTERNNGVLVYLLLADRAIEVVADRALHRRIAPADWQTLVEAMRGPLHEGRHEQALQTAVATLDGWLRQHFPADPSPARTRDNELPDPVELG